MPADQPVAQSFDRLVQGIQNLPWGVHGVIALAFVAGLVLWLFGRQVLKPVVAMLGTAFGAAAGFVLIPLWAEGTGVSPYVGLAAGSAIGLILSLMLYSLFTAVTFGSVMGGGFGLVAAALVGTPLALPAAAGVETVWVQPDEPGTGLGGGEQPIRLPDPEPEVDPIPDPMHPDAPPARTPVPKATKPAPKPAGPVVPAKPPAAPSGTAGGIAPSPTAASERIVITDKSTASERAVAFYQALRDDVSASWARVPANGKMWIVGSAVVGLGAGTVLGLMLPLWAAGAITALVGAAVWVPSGVWLAHAASIPGHERLSLSPIGWTIVWIAAALVGMAIQWKGLVGQNAAGSARKSGGKSKGKKKSRSGDDD